MVGGALALGVLSLHAVATEPHRADPPPLPPDAPAPAEQLRSEEQEGWEPPGLDERRAGELLPEREPLRKLEPELQLPREPAVT